MEDRIHFPFVIYTLLLTSLIFITFFVCVSYRVNVLLLA